MANLASANKVTEFCHLVSVSKNRRSWHISMPGHRDTRNRVFVKLDPTGYIMVECQKDILLGYKPCIGNSTSLCYHAIAAVKYVFNQNGFETFWSGKRGNLLRLRNTGGSLHCVKSKQSGSKMWVLGKKVEKKMRKRREEVA